MRNLYATTATLTALATPIPAIGQAQEFTTSGGVAITSEYVSQGLKFSDGPAVQAYVELNYGGFYAGMWGGSADEDLLFAKSEMDYYLGYAGEIGAFYYDVGVAYYTLQQDAFPVAFPTVDYEEYLVSAGYGVTPQLYVTANYANAPEFGQSDVSLDVDYFTNLEGLAIGATYGSVSNDFGDWDYWSVGGSYSLSDTVTFDLTYHDSDAPAAVGTSVDGLVVATISFDF